MDVLISRLHYPVTVLGPGRRAGIWFQGCRIRCPGCASRDTWPRDTRTRMSVADVMAWLDALPADEIGGVTISGGEPTDQPEALAELLSQIGRWRASRPADLSPLDVLVFTGRPPEWLDEPAAAVVDGADAVVAGPYVAELAGSSPLRGSENQRLVTRTALGDDRYAEPNLAPRSAVQVQMDGGELWVIGIPRPGDLARFEAAAANRGVRLRRRSWQS